jgi:hypothetical protein
MLRGHNCPIHFEPLVARRKTIFTSAKLPFFMLETHSIVLNDASGSVGDADGMFETSC